MKLYVYVSGDGYIPNSKKLSEDANSTLMHLEMMERPKAKSPKSIFYPSTIFRPISSRLYGCFTASANSPYTRHNTISLQTDI